MRPDDAALSPGGVVVRRDVHRGRVWSATPMVVLDDSPEELVAVRVPGAPWMCAAGYPGFDRMAEGLASGRWKMEELRWERTFAVSRVRSDRPYNLIHLFDAETLELQCWYVNFERPIRRHPDGRTYDTFDLALDLIVLPTSEPIWKDVEHWEWARDSGLFSPDDIAHVESARERLVADARSGRGDFDGAWRTWTPPPWLSPPELPADWNRPAATG